MKVGRMLDFYICFHPVHGLVRNFHLSFLFAFLGTFFLSTFALAQTVTYTYDQTTPSSDGQPRNGIGRLTSVEDSSGTTAFYYNIVGQNRRTEKTVDGVTFVTTTSYDIAGRITSVGYPDTTSVSYSYNGPALSQVYDATTTYVQYSGFNALGQPSTVTFGNGVTSTYTYSGPGNSTCPQQNFRLCTHVTVKGAVTLQSFQYVYDQNQTGVGNITRIIDSISGNRTFGYDDLNRLTSVTEGTGDYATSLSYSYDQIGNMMYNSDLGSYSYPPSGEGSVLPHAVTAAGPNSYSYDLNGNMIQGAGRTITYDAENRPVAITAGATTSTFVYDGDGGRVKKIVGSDTTVYIGKLYECHDPCKQGSTWYGDKYIFAGSERIAQKQVGSNQVLYYHGDHLGSSSVVTNGAGAIEQRLTYLPYGKTSTNSISATGVHHKYTSQELDDSTGLYFYNARYYDPVLGRFISPDMIVPNPRDPQDLNRYSYVNNNPLMYTDPSGHWKLRNFLKSYGIGLAWAVSPGHMAFIDKRTRPHAIAGFTAFVLSGGNPGAAAGAVVASVALQTGEGRQLTQRVANEFFDDVVGIDNPKYAYMAANFTLTAVIAMGVEGAYNYATAPPQPAPPPSGAEPGSMTVDATPAADTGVTNTGQMHCGPNPAGCNGLATEVWHTDSKGPILRITNNGKVAITVDIRAGTYPFGRYHGGPGNFVHDFDSTFGYQLYAGERATINPGQTVPIKVFGYPPPTATRNGYFQITPSGTGKNAPWWIDNGGWVPRNSGLYKP